MSGPRPVVIDTNVVIDAFVHSDDARSRGSAELLRMVERGEYIGIFPTPVLVEVYYVMIDITKDPARARKTLAKLMTLPNVRVQSVEREHAMIAIELIRESNYVPLGKGDKLGRREEGLSMVDSLVLAIGRAIPGAVVCSSESRFAQVRSVRTVRPQQFLKKG